MTFEQAKKYGTLWHRACLRHRLDPKDQGMRRAVTREALNGSAFEGQDRASQLGEDGLSILFRHLEYLAGDDANLGRAVAAVPEVAVEANERRQLVYSINGFGAKAAYDQDDIQAVAQGTCDRWRVACWTELPLESLRNLRMTIKARAASHRAKERREDAVASTEPF